MSRLKVPVLKRRFLHMAVLAAILGAGIFLTSYSPNVRGTLVGKWNDHTSNILSAQVFWKKGFRIYTEPTEAFKQLLAPHFDEIVSPILPRHYPPGLWIILFPITFAEQHQWISLDLASRLSLALYFLFALTTICLIFQLTSAYWASLSSRLARTSLAAFTILSAVELARWALNGMYDPVSVLLLLLSIKAYERSRFSHALVYYSLALFFHFRALWLAPLSLFAFVNYFRSSSDTAFKTILNPKVIFSGVLTVLSLVSFVLAAPGLKNLPINNYFFMGLPSEIHWWRFSLFILMTVIVGGNCYKSGGFLALSCIAWASFMWLLTLSFNNGTFFFLYPSPLFYFLKISKPNVAPRLLI
ncbi:MAG: hypothetical protein IPJ71_07450 [Bdellovibrionales bacterium]|nr:hypothetical protein [Bdellovibrionales bacterium]